MQNFQMLNLVVRKVPGRLSTVYTIRNLNMFRPLKGHLQGV